MTATTRTLVWVLSLFFIAATLLPLILADPTPPTTLNVSDSSRRNLSQIASAPINAQAGNITRLNITALSITTNWQGYYGNVSGTIVLADASNNTMYNWNHYPPAGEVYATRNSSIDWGTINCSNTTHIAQEESALGHSASDADSVTNTFNGSSHTPFFTGSRPISGCPSTNTHVNNVSQSSEFYSVLLADANNVTTYVAIIDFNETGYNGEKHDFQMLVGENGNGAASLTVTPYYFYVEIGS
jgi:hypothetical protein